MRQPTSHEQRSGASWDASYVAGGAPWDIGRPQQAFARLVAAGAVAGTVLDAGCGTGEHALLAAAHGAQVLGIDLAPTAVALAQRKAAERGIAAAFAVGDALALADLGRQFDVVLDCGLFHTFDAGERLAYVAGLAAVTRPGATVHILCFRDAGDDASGPHPVREDELRAAFAPAGGWRVVAITPDGIETLMGADPLPAWLASIERTAPDATSAAADTPGH